MANCNLFVGKREWVGLGGSGWWLVEEINALEGGKLYGKNLENAGNMNFFLMSEVVFHLF
jgi:hypothetical protein